MTLVHGTCILVAGAGVLLRGPSGAGKSDLALRLIDEGAVLVSDDQVEIVAERGRLIARAPDPIAGLMEVRGLGLLRLAHEQARLAVVIDLVPGQTVERLPDPAWVELEGVRLPRHDLNPWEGSASAKVRLAVRAARGTIMFCHD